jgi:hypothetical protein
MMRSMLRPDRPHILKDHVRAQHAAPRSRGLEQIILALRVLDHPHQADDRVDL